MMSSRKTVWWVLTSSSPIGVSVATCRRMAIVPSESRAARVIAPASERLYERPAADVADSSLARECLPTTGPRSGQRAASFRSARWATISTNDAAPSDQESEYFPAPSDSTWRSVLFASPPGGGRRSCPTSLPVRRSTQATVPLFGPNEARDVGAVHVHVDPKPQHVPSPWARQ